MTLPQLKLAIIENAKQIEICDTLQEMMVAVDYDQLINCGIPTLEYAYQCGIVTDNLIAEIPEVNMNNQGVFTNGSFTVANPDELFVLKDAIVTVNINSNTKSKINVFGEAEVTINISDNAYCSIKAFGDSTINLTSNNSAICNFQSKERVTGTINLNDNSVLQLLQLGYSNINLQANNVSALLAKLYGHAILSYTKSKVASVNISTYNASQAILSA